MHVYTIDICIILFHRKPMRKGAERHGKNLLDVVYVSLGSLYSCTYPSIVHQVRVLFVRAHFPLLLKNVEMLTISISDWVYRNTIKNKKQNPTLPQQIYVSLTWLFCTSNSATHPEAAVQRPSLMRTRGASFGAGASFAHALGCLHCAYGALDRAALGRWGFSGIWNPCGALD